MSTRRKIAFLKRGSFSHINANVAQILAAQFPEYELETIDVVEDILRRHKFIVALNTVLTLFRYARGIVRRDREFRDYFYRTPFIFHAIQRFVAERLTPHAREYAFSFQTQSLYDAGIPGLPHFVYTDHTHLANLYYSGFARRRLAAPSWIELEKAIYQNAAATFVMSRQTARSVVEQYGCPAEKVACVFGGYNFTLQPLPLQNQNYTNQQILFVGVDWERKGGPDLVAAFALVRKIFPAARLVIVGVSPRVESPGIEIVGRIPLEQMQQYFVRSSVFCLPSKVEPFGIACIEALINRIPVVATRINALADIVEDGASGRLVEPSDVPALAAALIELLSDPDKCRLWGEHGRAAAARRYTWDAVGRNLRERIVTVLGQKLSPV